MSPTAAWCMTAVLIGVMVAIAATYWRAANGAVSDGANPIIVLILGMSCVGLEAFLSVIIALIWSAAP